MNIPKDFKIGDIVEFAYDGEFNAFKGNSNNLYYDIGTVIKTTPSIKVLWKSDNKITEPLLCTIRLLKPKIHNKPESSEEYYLCMTKDEVDTFMSTLSGYKDEYCCPEYESTQRVIANLITFKNKVKEAKETEIQKALELLSNSGYTCTKN